MSNDPPEDTPLLVGDEAYWRGLYGGLGVEVDCTRSDTDSDETNGNDDHPPPCEAKEDHTPMNPGSENDLAEWNDRIHRIILNTATEGEAMDVDLTFDNVHSRLVTVLSLGTCIPCGFVLNDRYFVHSRFLADLLGGVPTSLSPLAFSLPVPPLIPVSSACSVRSLMWFLTAAIVSRITPTSSFFLFSPYSYSLSLS